MIKRFIVKPLENGLYDIWDTEKNEWFPDGSQVTEADRADLEDYCDDVLNHNYTESLTIKHDFVIR